MSAEPRQLKSYRALLIGGGTAYLVWWAFVHFSLPNAFNPLGSRVAVVACFYAVALASYVSKRVAANLEGWLTACCIGGTAHYFYLFDRNQADLNWVVGCYITVTACCALFQSGRHLLVYSGAVVAYSIALLLHQPALSFVVFLPGLVTNLVFVNVGLRARFKLLEKLKQNERELVRANEGLESFSYSVAHDLRAPLRAIDGFANILKEDHGSQLDAKASGHLARIEASANRAGLLIDGLLDLSRLTRKELNRGTVDLSKLAGEIAAQLAAANPARQVAFDCQGGVVAEGDPVLLRTLLENLLGNAWKFTALQAAPQVAFGKTAEGFFVRDNGAGFDMAYANKLFGPFQRLHTESEFPGTGVGLATVHRIVERHGGRVWAQGAVGQGATFFFTLA